ncbi:MAG: hypothetical protein KF686_03570 [Ramlibacter sp.]|nr:hypothetical protein [Ramlibacter sp.]
MDDSESAIRYLVTHTHGRRVNTERDEPTVRVPVLLDGPYSRPPSRVARSAVLILSAIAFIVTVLALGPGGFLFHK